MGAIDEGSYEILINVSLVDLISTSFPEHSLKLLVSRTHLLKRITPELIAIHELLG